MLAPGEQLLWWGRPIPTRVLSANSAILAAFALFFLFMGLLNPLFLGIALVFSAVFAWGIFSTKGYLQRTCYALTSARALKCVGGRRPRVSFAARESIETFQVLGGRSGGPASVILYCTPGAGVQLSADPSLVAGGPNPTLIPGLGLSADSEAGIRIGGAGIGSRQSPDYRNAKITFSRIDSPAGALAILNQWRPGVL